MTSHQNPLPEELSQWLLGGSFPVPVPGSLYGTACCCSDAGRDKSTTRHLHEEIAQFTKKALGDNENFATLAAPFDTSDLISEATFSDRLWAQLRALHEADRARHTWSPAISSDPESVGFEFSLASHPFFFVGRCHMAHTYPRDSASLYWHQTAIASPTDSRSRRLRQPPAAHHHP